MARKDKKLTLQQIKEVRKEHPEMADFLLREMQSGETEMSDMMSDLLDAEPLIKREILKVIKEKEEEMGVMDEMDYPDLLQLRSL